MKDFGFIPLEVFGGGWCGFIANASALAYERLPVELQRKSNRRRSSGRLSNNKQMSKEQEMFKGIWLGEQDEARPQNFSGHNVDWIQFSHTPVPTDQD